MQVKKRSGSTEEFMPEKIVVSMVKSGVSYEIAKEVAGSFSSRTEDVIESSAIKEHIFSEFKSRNLTSATDHWEKHNRKYKTGK